MAAPPVKLHIANKNYSSWSLRPWVLLKNLGVEFEECFHPFANGDDAGTLNRAEFLKFNPAGKVPALEFGNTVVWDSLAIVEFLAERYAGVWPQDAKARAWGRCVVAEMHSGFSAMRSTCSMNCGLRIELNQSAMTPALRADLARIDEIWTQGIKSFGGPFLGGSQFSAIDAFYAPVAFRAQTYHFSLSETAERYRETMLANQAMREWYMASLIEEYTDVEHEVECLEAGRLVADLRRPPRQTVFA